MNLIAHENGVLLPVRVKPRARRNGIEEVREGVFVVGVAAAPVEGAANAAVIEVLSRALKRPKSSLELRRGHKSRDKWFWCGEISVEEVRRKMLELLAPAEAP